jgi:hypothetical protein
MSGNSVARKRKFLEQSTTHQGCVKTMTPERIYKFLLNLYPRDFRDQYNEEMTRVFQENLASEGSSFGFWMRVIWDVISGAIREWFFVRGKHRTLRIGIREVGIVFSLAYGCSLVFTVLSYPFGQKMISYEISFLLPTIISIILGNVFAPETEIEVVGFRFATIELVACTVIFLQFPSLPFASLLGFGITKFGFPIGLFMMGLGKIQSTGFKKMPRISIILCLAAVANFTLNAIPFLLLDTSSTNQSFSLKHELWLKQIETTSTWIWLIIQFSFSLGLVWAMLSSRKSFLPPRALT